MAQELLHGLEIGAPVQQMGGKAVAARDGGSAGIDPKRPRAKTGPAAARLVRRDAPPSDSKTTPVRPARDEARRAPPDSGPRPLGMGAQGQHADPWTPCPRPGPFAPAGPRRPGRGQPVGEAHARAVEQFENARSRRPAGVSSPIPVKALATSWASRNGAVRRPLGRGQILGGVGLHPSRQHQVAVKGTHRRHLPSDAAPSHAVAKKRAKIVPE